MNENVVSFKTARELESKGFPQDITKGQLRYTIDGEKILVMEPMGELRLSRRDNEKMHYSRLNTFPIGTVTYFAPNAKDIWERLPTHYQPEKMSREDELLEDPEGYAALWIEENGGSGEVPK